MEQIKSLFLLVQDNMLLVFLIGIGATFLESFIPALPLLAIVIMNAALLGFWGGVISSAIGSCMGTVVLFLLANKFRNLKFIAKMRNEKTEKVTNWINKQGYIVLYLCYSSPFIPSCLISISSGLAGKNLKDFLPGMVLGKMTLFAIASYIGYDINGLLHNPIRIVIIVIMIATSFLVGKKISSRMTDDEITKIENDKKIL